MSTDHLDESVKDFKQFINHHPKMVREIRTSGRSWQEYYEKWALLGEDDPYWNQFKQESQSSDEQSTEQYRELLTQFMSMAEKIDLSKVQKQVGELNTTVSTVQQLFNQYLESRKKTSQNNEHPFSWFRD